MRKLLLATAAMTGALLATAGGAQAQPAKPVAPGTVSVYINGYMQFEVAGYNSTFNKVGGNKLNPVSTDGNFRLYPGFDAETMNGIAYGVRAETRITFSNAGKGVNSNSTSSNGTGSLYFRRAYGYVGTPEAGFGRFGQTDGAYTLLQSGVVEAFGDGAQWSAEGGPNQIFPSAAAPGQFIYADQGALYTTDKIVYLTPNFGGLSGSVSYEPNSNGFQQGYANCSYAGAGCAALSSSTSSTNIGTARKNTVDGMVQYALNSGGFNSKISGGWLYGAPINYTGTIPLAAAPRGYNNLSVYQLGAQTTFAGLTVGANIKGGQVEDGYGFTPKGARNGISYIVGASYVFGPYVLGANYFNAQTSGAYVPGKTSVARTLSEYGFIAGGNYVLSKNLNFFVEYLYGHRHQPGNTFGVPGNNTNGNAQVQMVSGGTTFKW
ncbi:MAG TPA: porin [Acidocella sp.]|nr:porin [Acidocella sp.]